MFLLHLSDTMGNKGAFITMNGKDMKPQFVTYDAVVSFFCFFLITILLVVLSHLIYFTQPHPDVKPMAYANSLMSLFG